MTDPELQGLALQALNMAKKDYAAKKLNCLLANYYHGTGIHRMKYYEGKIIETFGPHWLNSPGTKSRVFHAMRIAMSAMPCDAFVMVTAANEFRTTPAFNLLSKEEGLAILNAGHDRHHQAVKEGLLAMYHTLTAVAQTPQRVCLYIQRMNEYHGYQGPPKVEFYDQQEFDGWVKMFP